MTKRRNSFVRPRQRAQQGAAMVEYALASMIFIVTMLWIGFALERVAIGARGASLQGVAGSVREGEQWQAAGMVPCGAVIGGEDCY